MNTNTIKILIGVAVLVGLVLGSWLTLVLNPSQPTDDDGFGATNYNRLISFDEGIAVDNSVVITGTGGLTPTGAAILGLADIDRITFGGVVTHTVTGATSTLTAADLCDGGIVNINYGIAQASTTLPTAASLIADCTPVVGQWHETLIRNTSGTTNYLSIAAGASSTLEINAASSSIDDQIYGGEEALLRWIYVDSGSAEVDMFLTNYSDI